MPDPRDPLPDYFPDEVPLADAAEQGRPAAGATDPPIAADEEVPLESNPTDWHEQRLVVEDADEDVR